MYILENENIKLRALEPADLDALYEIENDTKHWHLSETLRPYSRDLLTKYLEEASKDIFEAKQLRLVISPCKSQEVLGLVDLFQFDPQNRRAGVGIIIKEAQRGNGYASQAIALMTEYAFKFLGLHQIYAHVPSYNATSLQLFEKTGFGCAGELKGWMKTNGGYADVKIYQLLNPEYS